MSEFETIKIIARADVATPLALTNSSRNGLATPANEDPSSIVYIYTPGGDEPPATPPEARIVCRHGIELPPGLQFQWQDINVGKNISLHFVAVHPAVIVEPGTVIPKYSAVTSIPLDGNGDETWGVAIDTRTMGAFTQPAVNDGTLAAWATSTTYALGDRCTNGGKVYVCSDPGTSAAAGGGPTGTGTAIADNTAGWDYDGDETVTVTVYDIETNFPGVGKRLFVEGGGFYAITARTGSSVTMRFTGEPGAIVTLAS